MKTFKSQICTTKEQSKKLLELGVKKETADMVIQESGVSAYNVWDSREIEEKFYPAWSLHRLIEICNKTKFGETISIYNNEVTIDGYLFEIFDNTYDNLISIIEWLIKESYFNKKYLKQ
jgi:hypothetical protein